MAITGKFAADFSEFQTAVQQAEVTLRGFETDAGKVESRLNAVSDAFSGRRIMQEAALAVKAVEEVGGATSLTAREQDKVNRLISEAIAKYEALGQQAPADMLRLHEATKRTAVAAEEIPAANQNILTSLAPLASAFGLAFSVEGVINFGREILADADALDRLSAKTGMALGPLQQLSFAAEQSGTTIEQVSSAIGSLQDRIAGGDRGAIAAVQGLGIELDRFKTMAPDEQFRAIALEVAKIEDPMKRAHVATELFGRMGRELLPLLTADIEKLGNAAPVMSDKAVKAFADTGDALDSLWTRTKVLVGETVSTIHEGLQQMSQSGIAMLTGDTERLRGVLTEVMDGQLPELPPAIDAVTSSGTGLNLTFEDMDRISGQLTTSAERLIEKNKGLAIEEANAKREGEALVRLQDSLFSRDAITRAEQYQTALGEIGNVALLTKGKKEELKRVVDAALESYAALGRQAPESLRALSEATVAATAKTFDLDAEIAKLHSRELPAFTGLLTNVEKKLQDTTRQQEAFRSSARFSAEVIETEMNPALEVMAANLEQVTQRQLSWSEAMDAVRRGEGTMGGQISGRATASRETIARAFAEGRYYGPIVGGVSDAFGHLIPGTYEPDYAAMGFLAEGGPVTSGRPYVVGERGPEIFVPSTSGRVEPRAGGTAVTVNVSGAILGTADELARLVGDALMGRLMRQGMRLPAGV